MFFHLLSPPIYFLPSSFLGFNSTSHLRPLQPSPSYFTFTSISTYLFYLLKPLEGGLEFIPPLYLNEFLQIRNEIAPPPLPPSDLPSSPSRSLLPPPPLLSTKDSKFGSIASSPPTLIFPLLVMWRPPPPGSCLALFLFLGLIFFYIGSSTHRLDFTLGSSIIIICE